MREAIRCGAMVEIIAVHGVTRLVSRHGHRSNRRVRDYVRLTLKSMVILS